MSDSKIHGSTKPLLHVLHDHHRLDADFLLLTCSVAFLGIAVNIVGVTVGYPTGWP